MQQGKERMVLARDTEEEKDFPNPFGSNSGIPKALAPTPANEEVMLPKEKKEPKHTPIPGAEVKLVSEEKEFPLSL